MQLASAISTFFLAIALTVMLWCSLFGAAGALFALSRDGDAATGAVWGILLGPFGFLAIAWTTRASAAQDDSSDLDDLMEDLNDA